MLTAVAVIFSAYLPVVASLANYTLFTLHVQFAYFVLIGIDALFPALQSQFLASQVN